MIVHRNFEQGSEEWFNARAGVITASRFGEIMNKVGGLTEQQRIYASVILNGGSEGKALADAGYKAAPRSKTLEAAIEAKDLGYGEDYSDAVKKYAYRMALERISGMPLVGHQFETHAMKRGRELEDSALSLFSAEHGKKIDRIALITDDKKRFGSSPDSIITDENAGVETKCFIDPAKVWDFWVNDNSLDHAVPQIQGGMKIGGFDSWYLVLYCPDLFSIGKHLWVKQYMRDGDYIAVMDKKLVAFDGFVEECRVQIESAESPLSAK